MAEPNASERQIASRLAAAEQEFRDLEARLADPDLASDPGQLRVVTTRYRALEPLIDALARQRRRLADRDAARELGVDAGPEDQLLLDTEFDAATEDLAAIDDELRDLLVPPDAHAGRPVIVEIRGAEGGEEANLFARDLYDMYVALPKLPT